MKKLMMMALVLAGVVVLSGCGSTINCSSCNAGNDYKCCPTGKFDADGECDD